MENEKKKIQSCGSIIRGEGHCPYLIATDRIPLGRGAYPLPMGRVYCLAERQTREICTVEDLKRVCGPPGGLVPVPAFCPYLRDGESWGAETSVKSVFGRVKSTCGG